ncbi:NAD(P)/FAD-dependent oxidoreductase [Pseudofrankia sp. BMG5.36]|uniref:flavin-containing monooxygenase n=1 Tax=Pseudofrankia sp. BMG5.36 TaxID=1834512 RepID=UPI0012FF8322|nr:NAD(P)/FAD-dependent oxidoreductase [Pseudofrankia sp. BMG5.36]
MICTSVDRGVAPSDIGPDDLRKHLSVADTARMLVCAVHLTGDLTLLDRYEAHVTASGGAGQFFVVEGGAGDHPVGDPEPDGLAENQVRAELTDILCEAVAQTPLNLYTPFDDKTTFIRLGSVASGAKIDSAYSQFLLEQAGFLNDLVQDEPAKATSDVHIAIIGAGMGGLDAAVRATALGLDYTILEKAAGVGGVWQTHRYPGSGVDTPSVAYSMSYELNPDWGREFPLSDEYRSYLEDFAAKHNILEHVRFGTTVSAMVWNPDDATWELTVSSPGGDRVVRANVVISSAGTLNEASIPNIEGLDSFQGDMVHTTHWRPLDVAGKRVAVIGTGAASIQTVASIASEVGSLTVFQRQPHYLMPNKASDIVPDSEIWLRQNLPFYLQWTRLKSVWELSDADLYEMSYVDREWMKTHDMSFSAANERSRQASLDYINECFGERSELARKVTPDYPFMTKRPLRDPGTFGPGGFYYALTLPHVELVAEGIDSIGPNFIRTTSGEKIEIDTIILCTGMVLHWMKHIDVVGVDGVKLVDVWGEDDPRAYLGGTVPGFPNFFMNNGPNTAGGHGGTHTLQAETVNHYSFECIRFMLEKGARSIEVTQEAFDDYQARLDEAMKDKVWVADDRAHNFWRNSKGRVILQQPWRLLDMWRMCRRPKPADFVLAPGPVLVESA